jgi:hypothetical protein
MCCLGDRGHSRSRGKKVACRVTTVERREAQRLSHQARAALARLRGGLDRKSSPKVPRKHLGASRRSIGLALCA